MTLSPEPVANAAGIETTKLRLKMEQNGEFQALREAAAAADMWRDEAERLKAELAAVSAENEQLAQQNASQRQYILELLEKELGLRNLLDRALEALA
jgi:hypothetical protein